MKIAVAGVLLGILFLVPARGAHAQGAADDAYAQKNYALSEKLYSEQLKSDPNNATFWYRLAVSEQNLGKFDDATSAYKKALALGYAATYVHYRIATLDLAQGRTADAVAELSGATGKGGLPPGVLRSDPAFASLQTNAQFMAIVAGQETIFNPCRGNAAYHALDFWIGDWSVVNKAGPGGGTSRIAAVADGCAILESWSGTGGELGQSLTSYDKNAGNWKQHYIGSGGTVSDYVGRKNGASMEFLLTNPNGSLTRMTFTPLRDGSVEQHFEASTDNGKNWTTVSDYIYSRAVPHE